MLDTLKLANRLKAGGFTSEQAETFAEAWAEQIRDDLPSKPDIAALDQKIARLDAKIDQRFAELDAKIEQTAARLDAKIEQRVGELNSKIEQSVTRLDAKIDHNVARLDGKPDKLTWMVGFSLAGIVVAV